MDDGALEWARTHVELTGPAVLVKDRPWSTVWRLPGARGPVWLKACPPGTAQEVRLLQALARWGVPHVLAPLAADPTAGRVLLPDGGPTLREVDADVPGESAGRWPSALAVYAQVQRATAAHVDEVVALGVPDLRLTRLPAVAAALVERWAPDLRGELPRWAEECAELDELGPAPTLQHDDLHDGNVFADGTRPFDWGDACVGHPFSSLLVGLDVPGPAPARAAYLAGWAGLDPVGSGPVGSGPVGCDPTGTDRAVALGIRLGRLTRAHSWERALAAWPDPPPEHAGAPARWLRTLVTSDDRTGGRG